MGSSCNLIQISQVKSEEAIWYCPPTHAKLKINISYYFVDMFQFIFFLFRKLFSRSWFLEIDSMMFWRPFWNIYKKKFVSFPWNKFLLSLFWNLGLVSLVIARISSFKRKRWDSVLNRFLRFHLWNWDYIVGAKFITWLPC